MNVVQITIKSLTQISQVILHEYELLYDKIKIEKVFKTSNITFKGQINLGSSK